MDEEVKSAHWLCDFWFSSPGGLSLPCSWKEVNPYPVETGARGHGPAVT